MVIDGNFKGGRIYYGKGLENYGRNEEVLVVLLGKIESFRLLEVREMGVSYVIGLTHDSCLV